MGKRNDIKDIKIPACFLSFYIRMGHKNGSYIKYLAFKRIQKNIFLWQEGRMFANAKKICLKSRLWRLLRK